MQVRMLIQRQWQDGGQERPLSVGVVYDLPDAIACALVATTAAERFDRAPVVAAVSSAPEGGQRRLRKLKR
jgi:hypothetical protein